MTTTHAPIIRLDHVSKHDGGHKPSREIVLADEPTGAHDSVAAA